MSSLKGSPLLSLAPELTLLVSDQLDNGSLKILRLVCKQLAGFLSHVLLHRLTIDITKENVKEGLSKLAALANSNHAAARTTRELFIKSLSPAYGHFYRGPLYKYKGKRWVLEKRPKDPPEVALGEQTVQKHLYKAIASLKAVQDVSWTPCVRDPEWAHVAVMGALNEMPDLRNFRVTITKLKIPLPIAHLKGLKLISVRGNCAMNEETYDNLAKAIAGSPQLESIDVDWGFDYRLPVRAYQSLYHLLRYYPSHGAPLKLRRLSLKTCLIRLDVDILPHLSHLTSLELMNIEDPFSKSFSYDKDPSIAHLYPDEEGVESVAEKKRYGFSMDEFWKAFLETDAHLEEVVIDHATPSFLQYLSSYRGLKKLHLFPLNFHDGHSSDEMAKNFFAKPFHNHCCSLQDLHIKAIFEGLWCFGEHNLSSVSKCEKLRILCVCIISSQIRNDGEVAGTESASIFDSIKRLLDTVTAHMPQIQNVRIEAATLESLREPVYRNAANAHYVRVGKMMARRVKNYIAPSSCRRLPPLETSYNGVLFVEAQASESNTDAPREPLKYAAKVLHDGSDCTHMI